MFRQQISYSKFIIFQTYFLVALYWLFELVMKMDEKDNNEIRI